MYVCGKNLKAQREQCSVRRRIPCLPWETPQLRRLARKHRENICSLEEFPLAPGIAERWRADDNFWNHFLRNPSAGTTMRNAWWMQSTRSVRSRFLMRNELFGVCTWCKLAAGAGSTDSRIRPVCMLQCSGARHSHTLLDSLQQQT